MAEGNAGLCKAQVDGSVGCFPYQVRRLGGASRTPNKPPSQLSTTNRTNTPRPNMFPVFPEAYMARHQGNRRENLRRSLE